MIAQETEEEMLKMLFEKKIKGIKAVGFDVGHTLIKYKNPLNWQGLYRSGLEHAAAASGVALSEDMILSATEVLLKYNTRVNYREWETTSDNIFNEILTRWGIQTDLYNFKYGFYSFFKADAEPYPETIDTMKKLKQHGIKIGILTDVAYGMDNEFSLEDISVLSDFIDIAITSVDVGFRKPNSAGYLKLLDSLAICPDDMIFIGDEEKDIIGAKKLGIASALINRSKEIKDFGQDHTFGSLSEIFSVLDL
ncbi:MAG: HAD family hydrolase [Ruminococcaceae bacterium]|nr:HAD family hydrolase [Oscillospiraceae bacterium]